MRLTCGVVALLVVAGCNRPDTAPVAAHGNHAAPTAAQRTTLLGNLGSYHRAITTANHDAQKFFDEGLTLLYGFNQYRGREERYARSYCGGRPRCGGGRPTCL